MLLVAKKKPAQTTGHEGLYGLLCLWATDTEVSVAVFLTFYIVIIISITHDNFPSLMRNQELVSSIDAKFII